MNENNERWPLYYSDTIHVSNLESGTAILCLWTKKERIISKIDEDNYCFIGQLYSKEYGLQILIRNLLGNPHIKDLVVVGVDLNDSSKGLINLFERGIDEKNKVVDTEILIDELVKKEHVDILRKRVKLHDLRKKDINELNYYLKKIKPGKEDAERIVIPLPKVKPPRRFPTEFSGYKARGRDFYEAYKSLVGYMLRFGFYNPEIKKLIVPNISFFVQKFSDSDKNYLKSRKKLVKEELNKSEFDETPEKYETYTLKSVDVWEELKDVAFSVSEKNNVCFLIADAYINENDLEDAVEMIDNQSRNLKWDPDPNGNIVIRVEEGLIKVMHVSQKGETLDEFSGKSAKELMRKIANEEKISIIYHALDIGAELQKAEISLIEGKKYVQDKNF